MYIYPGNTVYVLVYLFVHFRFVYIPACGTCTGYVMQAGLGREPGSGELQRRSSRRVARMGNWVVCEVEKVEYHAAMYICNARDGG